MKKTTEQDSNHNHLEKMNTLSLLQGINQEDKSVLYTPQVKPGDIVIVPQFLMHYTTPNPINFKKRILSFDFLLQSVLF